MAVIDYKGIADLEVPDDWDETRIQTWVAQNQDQLDIQLGAKQPETGFVAQMKRGAKSTANLATEGVPGLVRSAIGDEEGARKNLEAFRQREETLAAMYPRMVQDLENINSIGDAGTYFKETLGEGLPSILPSLLSGGVGAFLAKKFGEAAVSKLAKDAAESAVRKQITTGAVAGAAAGSFPLEAASSFEGIEQETGELRPGTAAFAGAAKAALEAATPLVALRRAMGPGTTDAVLNRALEKSGIVKRIAKGAGEAAAVESATEASQEAIDVAAEQLIQDNPELFRPDNVKRLVEAAAAGAIVGGSVGAGAGAISPSPEARTATTPIKQQPAEKKLEAASIQIDTPLDAREFLRLNTKLDVDALTDEVALQEAKTRFDAFAKDIELGQKAEELATKDDFYSQLVSSLKNSDKEFTAMQAAKALGDPKMAPQLRPQLERLVQEGRLAKVGDKFSVQLKETESDPAKQRKEQLARFASIEQETDDQAFLAEQIRMDAEARADQQRREEAVAARTEEERQIAEQVNRNINKLRMDAGKFQKRIDRMEAERAQAERLQEDAARIEEAKRSAETLSQGAQETVRPVKSEVEETVEAAKRAMEGRSLQPGFGQDANLYIDNMKPGDAVFVPELQRRQKSSGATYTLDSIRTLLDEAVKAGRLEKKNGTYSKPKTSPTPSAVVVGTDVAQQSQLTPMQEAQLAAETQRLAPGAQVEFLGQPALETDFQRRGGMLPAIGSGYLAGFADGGNFIALANSRSMDELMVVLGEEAFHIAQQRGILTDSELQLLANERPRLEAIVRDSGMPLDAYTPEQLEVEIPAKAFSLYNAQVNSGNIDRRFVPKLRRVFTKLRRFFKNLINAVRGADPASYETVEDLFDAFRKGDIQKREGAEVRPTEAAAAFSFAAKQIDGTGPQLTAVNNVFGAMSKIASFIFHPNELARRYPVVAPFVTALNRQWERYKAYTFQMKEAFKPYEDLKNKTPVNDAFLVLDYVERRDGTGAADSLISKDPTGWTISIPSDIDPRFLPGLVPGSVIGLDANQVAAFEAVQAVKRQAMDRAINVLENNLRNMDEAGELKGQAKKARDNLNQLIGRFKTLSSSFYMPHVRRGRYFAEIIGQDDQTVAFEMVKSEGELKKRLQELRGTYSDAKEIKYGVATYNDILAATERGLDAVDGMLAAIGSTDAQALRGFVDKLISRAAGKGFNSMLRESRNIPGYVTESNRDFFLDQGMTNFMHRMAYNTAQSESLRELKTETNELRGRDPNAFAWADKLTKDMQDPKSEAMFFRAVAFHATMGFNPSSAVLNMLQSFHSTLPLAIAMSGPNTPRFMSQAVRDLKLFGNEIMSGKASTDWNVTPAGITQENWDAHRLLAREGYTDPLNTSEMSAETEMQLRRLGASKLGDGFMKTLDWSGRMFSVAERINRLVAANYAIRAWDGTEGNTRARKNMELAFRSSRFAQEEFNKTNFAKYVIEKTQFSMAQQNRAMWQQGTFGQIFSQFMSMPVQMLEFWLGMFPMIFGNVDGANRRWLAAGGTTMLATLLMTSGLMGLPFADSLAKLFQTAYEAAFKEKINVEEMMQRFMVQTLDLDPTSASMVRRGGMRSLGIEAGARVGLGDLIPTDWFTGSAAEVAGGPFLNIVADRISKASGKLAQDEYMGALAQLMLPAAALNFYKGVSEVEKVGFQNSRGNVLLPPEKVTAGQKIVQGLGFKPTEVADATELYNAEKNLRGAVVEKRELISDQLVNLRLKEMAARRKGDVEEATKIRGEFMKVFTNTRKEDLGQPQSRRLNINLDTINTRVLKSIQGPTGAAQTKAVPKKMRPEQVELRNIFPKE